MMRAVLAVLAALSMPICTQARADWPQPRHDGGHTGRTDDYVQPPLELRWTLVPSEAADVPGLSDTVLAVGNSLYCTTTRNTLARIDAETGKIIWERGPFQSLYAIDGSSIVETYSIGRGARPLVSGFRISDLETGDPLFTISTDGDLVRPSPLTHPFGVADGTLIVSDAMEGPNGRDLEPWVRMFNTHTGRLMYETRCIEDRVAGPYGFYVPESPYHRYFEILACDRAFVLLAHVDRGITEGFFDDEYGWIEPTGRPINGPWALNRDRVTASTPTEYRSHPWGSAVLSEGGGAALGVEDNAHRPGGILSCRDASSGELRWAQPGYQASQMAVDGQAVYFMHNDGCVYSVDLWTGEVIWQTVVGMSTEAQELHDKALALTGKLPEPHAQAPVSLAGGLVWVVWDSRLTALDARSGEILWAEKINRAQARELVVLEGWIFYHYGAGIDAWGSPLPKPEDHDNAEEDVEAPEEAAEG